MNEKKNAFTLLETLTALSIISMILMFFIINFNVFSKISEKQEIKQLINDLNYNRNMAISSCSFSLIYLDFDKNSYSFKNPVVDNGKKQQVKLKHLKFIYKVPNRYEAVIFTPTGAPSKGYAIGIKGEHKKYEITIQPATGKVNLKEDIK